MVKGSKANLTMTRIAAAISPEGKSEIKLWDAVVPGLVVRVYASGRKQFALRYRPKAGGRGATPQHYPLGEVGALSLADARAAARQKLGEIAAGGDPSGERKEARRRERALLATALDRYEQSLERRRIVKRKEVMSLLRRELLAPLGNRDLAELDRPTLVGRIAAVEQERPGAAQDLRSRLAVFLGWAVNEGLITGSPLAGWRRERRSRAERLEQPGRALSDQELPTFWAAASDVAWPFGPYLQLLLLLGQRRTETAFMRWPDLDLEASIWTIPAEVTKSGRAHQVPLPQAAVTVLKELPRLARADLVFPGRRQRPMTGWSKRLRPVLKATTMAGMAPWTLHDLRRTVRSGMGALGIDREIAELTLNHAVSDELSKIYDRHDYWRQRVQTLTVWATHVMAMVEGGGDKVVPLRQAK